MDNTVSIRVFDKVVAASLRPVLWKNGGGVTREIAQGGAPGQPFDWRVSVADVDQPGPFSTFERIDRVLVMTRGEQMVLKDGDDVHELACWQPFAFAGEAPITAQLPCGPTRDFNLMVRRAFGRGKVHVHQRAEPLAVNAGIALFHCAAGAFTIETPGQDSTTVTLEEGDTLHVQVDARTIFDARPVVPDSTLIDARIEPIGASRH